MTTRYYKVDEVGGGPIYAAMSNDCSKNVATAEIQFGKDRCVVNRTCGDEKMKLDADLEKCTQVWFEFGNTDGQSMTKNSPFQGKDVFMHLVLKLGNYTIQIEKPPVEMTIEEIEKKLGHRVLIRGTGKA